MPSTTSRGRPSYHQDFARGPSRSAYPGSWKGLVGAWVPALGVTGGTLRDVSGFGNDATLTNMNPTSDWIIGGNSRLPSHVLDFNAATSRVTVDSTLILISDSAPFTIAFGIDPTRFDSSDSTVFVWRINATDSFACFILDNVNYSDLTFARDQTSGPSDETHRVDFPEDPFINQFWDIVIAYDGVDILVRSSFNVYINGIERTINASASTGNPGDANIIGDTDLSGDRAFDGRLSYFYLYNTKLIQAEAIQLHQNLLAPFILRPRVFAAVAAAGIGTDYVGPIWQQQESGGFVGRVVI